MAFVRKAGQAVQTPGYQTGGKMLGGAQTGSAQPATEAGSPGGWTNIQDYLSANQGDMTNVNTAKEQTASKIQEGAKSIQEQKATPIDLPKPTEYSAETTNKALADDDYGVFSQGLTQQNAQDQMSQLPSVQEQIYGNAPLETRIDEITNLDPSNFDKTMQFVGGLSQDPNYSQGARAFDSMLLQGSPEFRQNFVPQTQQQYQELYKQPLQAARDERQQFQDTQGAQAISGAQQGWQTGINDWLSAENAQIAQAQQRQQDHYSQMQQSANIDVQKQIADYTAQVGSPPTPDTIRLWEKGKADAQGFLGSQVAPTEGMAFNEYTGSSEDPTKMQDILALYELMGQTPQYAQPVADETYNYQYFM